jgi:hypothetical protein
MMPISPISTVIELFYPEAYAHDYEWTTRALGMKHFAARNDRYVDFPLKEDRFALTPHRSKCSSTTYPELTWPNYPEGFQGSQIPVYGPYVAKLIEDRADGFLP